MLDLNHLARDTNCNIAVFSGSQGNVTERCVTYAVPRGTTMMHIICIGPGGGGAGGLTRAANVQGTGGGGGGGGSTSRLTVFANLLPKALFMTIPSGGVGGGAGSPSTAGGVTGETFILASQYSNVGESLLTANHGNGGGAASSGSGGNAGAGGPIGALGNCVLAGIGHFASIAGQTGTAGGFDAAGGALAIPVTSTLSQGGGGGTGFIDTDTAGGTITAIAGSLLSEWRQAGAVAGSNPGSSNAASWKPFFNFGGLGGACSNASVGGNGAPGAGFGSGGGGGGSGTTGGRGGDGAPGCVIIISW